MSQTKFIDESAIAAGDVLMCYSRQMIGEPGCETGYSHAAIHLGLGEILESDAAGVKIGSIDDILIVYDHIAILRAPHTWSQSRIDRLKQFGLQQVGKKFNIRALPRIEYLKQHNIETAQQQIEDFFAGLSKPVETDRKSYFCSELVVSAFIDAGIINQSAAILFKPETLLPIDIAKDKAFGFFVGYVLKSQPYAIRDDDWFQLNI